MPGGLGGVLLPPDECTTKMSSPVRWPWACGCSFFCHPSSTHLNKKNDNKTIWEVPLESLT